MQKDRRFRLDAFVLWLYLEETDDVRDGHGAVEVDVAHVTARDDDILK